MSDRLRPKRVAFALWMWALAACAGSSVDIGARPSGGSSGTESAGSPTAHPSPAASTRGSTSASGSAPATSSFPAEPGPAMDASTSASATVDAADAGSDAGAPRACVNVKRDYGRCAKLLGWGFDGNECRAFSGCGCAPHCEHFFQDALACATSCSAAGKCDTAAMKSLHLARKPFVPGIHCDGVHICTPAENRATLATLFPEMECETQEGIPCPPGLTCAAYPNGTVTQAEWGKLCAAGLLPEVKNIYCIVWGP